MGGLFMLPEDPMMLLSYVNTQLRDFYESLEGSCSSQDVSAEELKKKLKTIDYEYDEKLNKFV